MSTEGSGSTAQQMIPQGCGEFKGPNEHGAFQGTNFGAGSEVAVE